MFSQLCYGFDTRSVPLHSCNAPLFVIYLKFRQGQMYVAQFPTATWTVDKTPTRDILKFRQATWVPPLAGPLLRLFCSHWNSLLCFPSNGTPETEGMCNVSFHNENPCLGLLRRLTNLSSSIKPIERLTGRPNVCTSAVVLAIHFETAGQMIYQGSFDSNPLYLAT